MSQFNRRLLALCLPAVLVWSVDCTLTLCGQSEECRTKGATRRTDEITSLHNYTASVNEVASTSSFMLTWHPLAYIGGTILESLCSAH